MVNKYVLTDVPTPFKRAREPVADGAAMSRHRAAHAHRLAEVLSDVELAEQSTVEKATPRAATQ